MSHDTVEFQYNSLQRYFSEVWTKKNFSNESIAIPLFCNGMKSSYEDRLPHYAIIACLIYLYRINSYTNLSVWLNKENKSNLDFKKDSKVYTKSVLTTGFQPHHSIRKSTDSLISSISSFLSHEEISKNYLQMVPDHQNHEHTNIAFLILESISLYDESIILNPEDVIFIIALKEKKITISSRGKLTKIVKSNIKHHIISTFSLVINSSKININKFDFMSDGEKKLIMNTWNNTEFELPSMSIPSIFEKNCIQYSNKIGITFDEKFITYKELNEHCNRLARYFLSLNIRQGSFICMLLERSIDMIITILAILKIGAVYIPIDSKYPLKRIKYIIQNSKSKYIIASVAFQSTLNKINHPIKIFYFDKIKNSSNSYSDRNLSKLKNNKKIAYLMYTSGSTGKPKGVLISHRNIINYALWFNKKFEFDYRSSIDFSSSIGFDLAVACTLVPLIVGATIAICDDDTKLDPHCYLNYLSKNYITHIECIPDYFNHLLSYQNQVKKLIHLKWVLLGGDAVVKKDLEKWIVLNKRQNLVNEYGPTECTVAITSYTVDRKSLKYQEVIPIGKPAHNTHAFILDKYKNICPALAIGELFIGGESVSPGYLDKDKNVGKFINKSLLKSSYKKYYNTGDLAKWLPSGDIAFLGRLDHQIKINGFRIELTEIENQLLENPKVKKCKVIAKTTMRGEKFLTAYVVLGSKGRSNCIFLKDYLKKYLPNYMIPSQITNIDSFPTNASGKVDIQQLSLIEISDNLVTPEALDGDAEKLFKVWENLLGHRNFSLSDNFLDVGGGSLLTARLMLEIENQFSVRLPLSRLSVKPTINFLLELINEFKSNQIISKLSKATYKPQTICLKETGSDSPLFLIPPVGGTVFIFKKFVDYLNCDRQIFALQDPAIENPRIKFKSIQFMAKHYISVIKAIQPKGPYSIAGASFGATLAIEIINQLLNSGNTIHFLGLFDGWAIYSNELKDVQFFSDFMNKKMLNLNSQYAKSLIQIQFDRESLLFEYKIPNTSIEINLFKAIELWPIFKSLDSPKNHWERFIDSKINVYNVNGDHESMFYEPNVEALAQLFALCLETISN